MNEEQKKLITVITLNHFDCIESSIDIFLSVVQRRYNLLLTLKMDFVLIDIIISIERKIESKIINFIKTRIFAFKLNMYHSLFILGFQIIKR